MDLGAKEAELRASGWSDGEIRDYRRGYEGALTGSQITLPPAPPEPLPSFTEPHAPRVIARGDRGTWTRSTLAGQIKAVVSPDEPDEPAREMQAAREWIDQHEFVYGRRPSMTEARMAVGRRSDGATLSGTAEEIGRVFAQAGLPYSILREVRPLPPPGAVIHQPTRG